MQEKKEIQVTHFGEREIKANLPFEEWLERLKTATDRDTILSCLHSGLRGLNYRKNEEAEQCLLVYLHLARDWSNALPDPRKILFTQRERDEEAKKECTVKAFTELARAFSVDKAVSSRELFEGTLQFFSYSEHVPREPRLFYEGIFRDAAQSLRYTFFEFAKKVWSFGADERPGFIDVRDFEERRRFRTRCRKARPALLSVWLQANGEGTFWLNRLVDCNGAVQKMLWERLRKDWKCRELLEKDPTQPPGALLASLSLSSSYPGQNELAGAAILCLAQASRHEKAKALWQRRAEARKKAAEEALRVRERAVLEAQKAELEAQLAALRNRM